MQLTDVCAWLAALVVFILVAVFLVGLAVLAGVL